jgi:hypothetical protein
MSPAGDEHQHEQHHDHGVTAPERTAPHPASRRYRSTWVVMGATAAVLGGLVLAGGTGDDEEYDYAAVCVDDAGTRIADDRCDDPETLADGVDDTDGSENGSGHGGGGHWYFIPVGSLAPRIGQRATGGSTSVSDLGRYSVHAGGVDAKGGTVSRGGFGGRGGSVGG